MRKEKDRTIGNKNTEKSKSVVLMQAAEPGSLSVQDLLLI